MSPPTTTQVIYAKQVDTDSLTPLARDTLHEVCPQFLEGLPSWTTQSHNYLADHYADVGRERRFAGGHTLPRGRYYSLCESNGEDHGTLLYELLAYSANSSVYPFYQREVDLHAEDVPRDSALYERPSTGRAIRVRFPLLEGAPHPYVARRHLRSLHGGTSVYLPLAVLRLRVDGVLDLRTPAAAAWLVQHCSKMRGRFWPARPLPTSFRQVLPSAFALGLGGDDFTKNIGLSLREIGIHALIYPSVRMDCGVIVESGEVVEWAGWNLVDYRGCEQRATGQVSFFSGDDFWPEHASLTDPLGTKSKNPRICYLDIHFHHELHGLKGSWKVEGLSRHTTTHQGARSSFKEFGSDSV